MTASLEPTVLWRSAAVCVALLASGAVFVLARVPATERPRGGRRALARLRARASSSLFVVMEPVIYRVAGLVEAAIGSSLLRGTRVGAWAERRARATAQLLIQAGEPLGLEPVTFVALSLVVGGVAGGAALLLGGGAFAVALLLLGVALPSVRFSSLRLDRLRQASREMPVAIELVALAMGAGLDFPGAVRRVVQGQTGVVAEELGHLLIMLDLGIGRAAALATLAERLPVTEVRDLVRVVTLADKKGASISDALAQLAATSRLQRSVRAEEAAARAGVLLLGPLMLLLVCVLILLLAPLLVGGVGF